MTAEAGQHHLVINRQIIQDVEFLLGKPLGDDKDAERDERDNQDREAWKESQPNYPSVETGCRCIPIAAMVCETATQAATPII